MCGGGVCVGGGGRAFYYTYIYNGKGRACLQQAQGSERIQAHSTLCLLSSRWFDSFLPFYCRQYPVLYITSTLPPTEVPCSLTLPSPWCILPPCLYKQDTQTRADCVRQLLMTHTLISLLNQCLPPSHRNPRFPYKNTLPYAGIKYP